MRSGLSLAAAALIFGSVLMAVRQLRHLPAAPETPAWAASLPPALADQASPFAPGPTTGAAPALAPVGEVTDEMGDRVRDELRGLARDDAPAVADRLLALMHEKSA